MRRSVHFLGSIRIFTPIIVEAVRHDLSHIEEFAFQFAQRQIQSNVIYTEVRYNPHLFFCDASSGQLVKPGNLEKYLPADAFDEEKLGYSYSKRVIMAVTNGLRRAEKEYAIQINQIICCLCFQPEWSPDLKMLMEDVQSGRFLSGEGSTIVSVDVASGETHFIEPALGKPHQETLNSSYDKGFDICIQSGESAGGFCENVKRAVENYSAIRIGHGYKIFEDLPLLQNDIAAFLKNDPKRHTKPLHFECCPSSSYHTGGFPKTNSWQEHPQKKLYDISQSCGINTDDPSIMDITLNSEYELVVTEMKMTKESLLKMGLYQIESCFVSDQVKEKLRETVQGYYDVFA